MVPAERGPQRAPSPPAEDADLDRWWRREAHAEDRREYADGWNVPFISPDEFGRKRAVLLDHCETVGRDASEIRCAINAGLAWTEESLVAQFGQIADFVRPGVLGGSIEQVLDQIGRYVDAGADQVNIALRAPFDLDALEQFAAALKLG